MNVPCLCINDKNKPNEILLENWVIEGTKYTINYVYYYPHLGLQGVTLNEVQTKSEKYNAYRLDRFAFTQDGLNQLIELMKECTELGKIDIMELIEESNLKLIES